MKPNTDNCTPVMVVIGSTGTGKSTLCNIVSGRKPDDQGLFPVSSGMSSCTNKTTANKVEWSGEEGREFVLIDTPGLNDPTPLKDSVNILEMAEELKKLEAVNVFLIVFNGASPRFDSSLIAMVRIFQGMFGKEFLEKNVVFEFTNWGHDKQSVRRRGEDKNEEYWTREINRKLGEAVGEEVDAPAVFIDSLYDENDLQQKEKFEEEMRKLEEYLHGFPPYACEGFEAVKTQLDQAEEDKKVLTAEALAAQQAREKSEIEARMANDARERSEEVAFAAKTAQMKSEEEARLAVEEEKKSEEEAKAANEAKERSEAEAKRAKEQREKSEAEASAAKKAKEMSEIEAKLAEEAKLKSEQAANLAREEKAKADKIASEARLAKEQSEEEANLARDQKLKSDAEALAANAARQKSDAAAATANQAQRKFALEAKAAMEAKARSEVAARTAIEAREKSEEEAREAKREKERSEEEARLAKKAKIMSEEEAEKAKRKLKMAVTTAKVVSLAIAVNFLVPSLIKYFSSLDRAFTFQKY